MNVFYFFKFLAHEIAGKKLKDWGLILRPEPVKLEGPAYKRENILLGNGVRKQVGVNMDWGLDVAKCAMFVAVCSIFLKKICMFFRVYFYLLFC